MGARHAQRTLEHNLLLARRFMRCVLGRAREHIADNSHKADAFRSARTRFQKLADAPRHPGVVVKNR
jgi:hypothetical protein